MIFGINESDAGADSNGAGKSTIIEAITLAMTGSTCRDVLKDEFISDNEDDCYIQFDLENSIGDVNELSIRRWFNRKKSAKVEIWENGEKNKEITSVNEANKRIYELIGLTREDLLHFFIIGQDTHYSFLTAGDVDKKNIIARIANTDKINTIIENLKFDKKEKESGDLMDYRDEISKIETKVEMLVDQISDLNKDKQKEIKEEIDEIDSDISDYEEEIEDLKKSKITLKKQTKILADDLVKYSDIDDNSVKDNNKLLDDLNDKNQKNKSNLRKAKSTIEQLELVLEGMITCPSCDHQFNPSSDLKHEEIGELIDFSKEQEEEINKKINKVKKLITTKETFIKELKSKLKTKREAQQKFNSKSIELSGIADEITRLEKNIEKLKESKTQVYKRYDTKSKVKDLKYKIVELESRKLDLQKLSEEIEKEISTIDYWIYHFGKKGFSTFLSNKSVKVIEGVTNSYLKKFNSELQVQIDGFTILKSGDLSEKISVSVLRNGMQVGSYKRYSGGEKGRINLANIVGLQKLMNMSAHNGGLNFLALDEVFDGLDRTGQGDVISILENIGVTTLVVSHRNEPIGSEHELFITKSKGISHVE